MKRSRLAAALLASFVVLHLTVAGGLAGALHRDGMADGMTMRSAQAVVMGTMSTDREAPPPDEAPCPDEPPCSMLGMPGPCPSILSCALALSASVQEVAFDVLLPFGAAVASPQLPHTRTSPPELPPPRA